MTDSILVLELLDDIKPRGRCDDCLSEELDIRPRQTINQICRTLYAAQSIARVRAECARCGKVKITNSRSDFPAVRLPVSGATSPRSVGSHSLDIEKVRTEIVQICRELWRETQSAPASHSISITINTLKNSGTLPSHQANLMLTLCNLRNVHVYEGLQLGLREMTIADNARELVVEWWRARK